MSRDEVRPLPEQYRDDLPPPPFNDVPLVSQHTPEQRAFVDAYNHVGRPRIVVFVNRTLEGELMPVNRDDPIASIEHSRRTNAAVSVDRRQTNSRDRDYNEDRTDRSDRFETRGPAEYRETTDVYLHRGQYDEVSARSLDYEAVENILTDWISADGKVEVISPTMARHRLSDDQVKDVQSGKPRAMSEMARQLDADVLVQVQARPTRQTEQGLEVRLIAEAMNIKGGQSIGRAVLDVPPPLDKPEINKYTRFLARKLMDGMLATWQGSAESSTAQPESESGPRRETQPATTPATRRDTTAPRTDSFGPRTDGVKESIEVPDPTDAANPAADAQPNSAKSDSGSDAAAAAAGAEMRANPVEVPIAPPEKPLPPSRNPAPPAEKPPTPPEVPMPAPDKGDAIPVPAPPPTTQERPIPQPEKPAPPATQETPQRPGPGQETATTNESEVPSARGFQQPDPGR